MGKGELPEERGGRAIQRERKGKRESNTRGDWNSHGDHILFT